MALYLPCCRASSGQSIFAQYTVDFTKQHNGGGREVSMLEACILKRWRQRQPGLGRGGGGGGAEKKERQFGGGGPPPCAFPPFFSSPPPPPFFFRAIQFIYGRQSISESGSSVLCVLLGLSLVLIVRHVLHVVSHMASWAGGPLTKPKLCPAFKTSIVVCERKTN